MLRTGSASGVAEAEQRIGRSAYLSSFFGCLPYLREKKRKKKGGGEEHEDRGEVVRGELGRQREAKAFVLEGKFCDVRDLHARRAAWRQEAQDRLHTALLVLIDEVGVVLDVVVLGLAAVLSANSN